MVHLNIIIQHRHQSKKKKLNGASTMLNNVFKLLLLCLLNYSLFIKINLKMVRVFPLKKIPVTPIVLQFSFCQPVGESEWTLLWRHFLYLHRVHWPHLSDKCEYIHWASKETYHFFRAMLTKIHHIKMNYIWTQISYTCSSPHEAHLENKRVAFVKKEKNVK